MCQLILMLIVAWICIYSLVSNICLGGILQSTDKQPIDRMQDMKRHWSSLLRCLRNWFDKTWLSEAKVMKLHHSYLQIGTSSQQTHTSQVSMKMWSKVGQENPKKKIQLHCETVLFVHQTKWQRLLLNQFRNEITLLGAIYKTIRYELLLFFLVVRVNMNCIGVGSFIIQSETIAAIQELLAIFHY